MTIPQSAVQVLIVLLAIIPGFVFSAVKARRRGPSPEDRELSVRLLRSFGMSAAFLAMYLLAFGVWGVEQMASLVADPADNSLVRNPRLTALMGILLLAVIPTVLAVLDDVRQEGRLDVGKVKLRYEGRYDPTPSAWDFAGPALGNTFIRIRLTGGTWVGGWFSTNSFLSSYPEPRDVFIESQWKLDEEGRFIERVEGTQGVYVPCANAEVIEWVLAPAPSRLDERNAAEDDEAADRSQGERPDHPSPGAPAKEVGQ